MQHGRRIGYLRLPAREPDLDRHFAGLAVDLTFADVGGLKQARRPQFDRMLDLLRPGDTVVTPAMDRFARSLGGTCDDISILLTKGVRIELTKERLIFAPEQDSGEARLLLRAMAACAEFERALGRQRQREGIEAARARCAYQGRKPTLDAGQVLELRRRVAEGESKAELAREFGISRETVYRYLRQSRGWSQQLERLLPRWLAGMR